MYWSEMLVIRGKQNLIVLLIHKDKFINSVPPHLMAILRPIRSINKRKWRKEKNIRNFILHEKHPGPSLCYGSRFLGYKNEREIKVVSKNNHLYCFDKDIIKKTYPLISFGLL